MALQFDGHFIVGGHPSARVAPNFKLRELTRKNGIVRVHRETVSAIQILRDRFDASITVVAMRPLSGLGEGKDGLFAWIDNAADSAGLEQLARALKTEGLFQDVERRTEGLFVCIPDPTALPPISADAAMVTAIRVTSGFETSGDPFQQVTGNFDDCGMSFGPSQVNFGSGTLKPLFDRFRRADEDALRRCFRTKGDYATWKQVLRSSKSDRLKWADSVSKKPKKATLIAPWRGYFRAIGRVPAFRQLMTDFAREKYGAKLATALKWIQSEGGGISIDSLRAICALYDLCTQQGSLNKAHDRIRRRIAAEAPTDQIELVRIAAEERGSMARLEYRADCVSRRLGVLFAKPMPAAIDGFRSTRSNRFFYLLRDVKVADPATLTE